MKPRTRRVTPALILAFVALFVALTGVAAARLIITNSSQVKRGALQASDLSAAAKRSLKGNRGPRGLRGTAGAPGAPGATGAPGAPGAAATKLWALVSDGGSSASVVRQSGNVSVAKSNVSGFTQYRVTFPQDISGCVYLATAGNDGVVGQSEFVAPATMSVARSSQDARTVAVNPWQGNTSVPSSFHLAVFC